jgi:hypothetical protein
MKPVFCLAGRKKKNTNSGQKMTRGQAHHSYL